VGQLFARHGIAGLVCHYRVAPHRFAAPHLFPAPIADVARAVRVARDAAGELGIDPQRLALMGFSAGGHAAATVATQPALHQEPEDDLIGRVSARPNRTILAYPVISMVRDYHKGCVENLLGPNADRELRRLVSNELWVDAETPPAFLFHTADDPSVPVSNSVRYAQACWRNGVPAALHIFPKGRHGVGLAQDEPALAEWPQLLLDWLADWL
jgi:acetyl esterase/lipase